MDLTGRRAARHRAAPAEGSIEPLAAAYDRYGSLIYRLAQSRASEQAEAERITRAAFLGWWRRRPEGNALHWLVGAVMSEPAAA